MPAGLRRAALIGAPALLKVAASRRLCEHEEMSFIVETDRLGMRPFHPDDAEPFLAMYNDPAVMRYLTAETAPSSVEEMRQRIVDYPDYKKHGFGRWSCILKETGKFIGFSGLKFLEKFHGEVDLGYRFFPEFWGKGLATESGLASIQYGFEVLNLKRIIGMAIPENKASVRVLEKCGMSFEGYADYDGTEAVLYAFERRQD